VTSILRWVRSLPGRVVSDVVRGVHARLRLRTKLLLSFVLMTTCLTSITLLVLRREVQGQVQHQIEQDARNAILTSQTVQRQQQSALARKADLEIAGRSIVKIGARAAKPRRMGPLVRLTSLHRPVTSPLPGSVVRITKGVVERLVGSAKGSGQPVI